MRKHLSTAIVEFLKVWGLLILIVIVGFVATYQYVGAPPPKVIRIATGAKSGAYYAFAQRYARLLANNGIALEVVSTAGSVENFALLKRGEVSLALVQGGSATDDDKEHLQSLGSLFLEPVWVFTRKQTPIKRFVELKGKRVAVGAAGSGTYLLTMQLLSAAGITESNTTLVRGDLAQAIASLSQGTIDAAFFVAAPIAPLIQTGGVLEQKRQFPSIDLSDLPLNEDARRYITNGPSFLFRWLPYGTAVLMDRLKILVLPFLALLIPLFRIAPPLYSWRVRSKIFRWYAAVREIDSMIQKEPIVGGAESVMNRLKELEREVASVSVPLSYAGELYHLRMHISFLQEKLEKLAGESSRHAVKSIDLNER